MSIAVLHDNSNEGKLALRAAVAEARAHGTDLIVVGALSGSAHPGAAQQEAAAVETTVARTLVDIDQPPVWRVCTTPPNPDTVGAVLGLIEETNADLLVVGSRHRSAVGKLLMGQVAHRLLLESPVPVLLVKS